jgi:peptidoglycan/xylan/chitin deacetylase (PgdA/CDA1 family)
MPAVLPVIGSIRGVTTAAPQVALTFDDGPTMFGTGPQLDLLARFGAKATFFLLAERAEQHPELVRRMREEGHEIALHGVDHRRLTECSPRDVIALVRDGRRRLEAIAGTRVRLFRPPFGAQSAFSYAAARLSGMEVIGWTLDPQDWREAEGQPSEATAWMTDGVAPGGMVLLHDGRDVIAERLLKELGVRDIRAVTVSELLTCGRPVRFRWFHA